MNTSTRLLVIFLSVFMLANCGSLKVVDHDGASNVQQTEYKLVGDNIVKIDHKEEEKPKEKSWFAKLFRDSSSTSSQSRPLRFKPKQVKEAEPVVAGAAEEESVVTSSPMFTPKKHVEPFVTSEGMFKVKNPDRRTYPKILEKTIDVTKTDWFQAIKAGVPDGYNVDRYKPKPANEEPEVKTLDEYKKADVVKEVSYDDVDLSEDEAKLMKEIGVDISGDVNVVGIDKVSRDKEDYRVPDDDDLSDEYKDMLYDSEDYQVVDDVSKVDGDIEEQLFFSHGSAKISDADKSKIKSLSKDLSDIDGEYKLNVVGHASHRVDTTSDPKQKKLINFKMAKERADSVSKELKKNGIASNTILAVSKGDDDPNPNPGDKSQEDADRRVDIYLDDEDSEFFY